MRTATMAHAPARTKPLEALLLWGAGLDYPMYEGIIKSRVARELKEEWECGRKGIVALVQSTATRLDRKDSHGDTWQYTRRHSLEVAYYSCLMAVEAKAAGLRDAQDLDLRSVFTGGFTHDIGKTFLPLALVAKERGVDFGVCHAFGGLRLSDNERNLLRREHVSAGLRYFESFGDWPGRTTARDMVQYHHVMYDGKSTTYPSYPGGLKGWELPSCANIAKTADFISAIGHRHYRKHYGREDGVQWLGHRVAHAVAVAGQELCPSTVACFITAVYGGEYGRTEAMVKRLGGKNDASDPQGAGNYAMAVVRNDSDFAAITKERDASKLTVNWMGITRCAGELGAPALYKVSQ